MSESLASRIKADLVAAMKAKEKERVGSLRLIQAAAKKKQIDSQVDELSESEWIAVLRSMAKQCNESLTQFEKGGREDLASKTRTELELVESYLPKPLSESEVEAIIDSAMAEVGAASMKDMGKVMKVVQGKAAGRADGKVLSERVKQKLSN